MAWNKLNLGKKCSYFLLTCIPNSGKHTQIKKLVTQEEGPYRILIGKNIIPVDTGLSLNVIKKLIIPKWNHFILTLPNPSIECLIFWKICFSISMWL